MFMTGPGLFDILFMLLVITGYDKNETDEVEVKEVSCDLLKYRLMYGHAFT